MSNMEEYATTMKQFLLSRTNRGIFRDIKKLDHDALIAELIQRGCNAYGSRPILEERLLRAKLREEPNLHQTVPWFEYDIEGAEEREPVRMRESLPKRKRTSKQVAPEKQVHFCDERDSDGDSVAHRKRVIVQAEVHAPPPNGRRSGVAAQRPIAVDEYRQVTPRQPLQSRENFVVPDQRLMMDEAVYKIVQEGDYQYRAFSRRTQTMPMQALAGENAHQAVPTSSKPPVPLPRRSLCMFERSRQSESNAENETRPTPRERNNVPRQHHRSASQTQPAAETNRTSNMPQYSAPRVNAYGRDARGDAKRRAEQTRVRQEPNYDDIQPYESELEQPSGSEIEHEWCTPLLSSTRRPSRVDYEADESDSSVYRTPMMTTPRMNTLRDVHGDISRPRANTPAPMSNTPWATPNFGLRAPVNRVIEPDFSDESDVEPRKCDEPRRSSVRSGPTPRQSSVATGADASLKVWKLVQGWRLKFSGEDKNEDAEAFVDRINDYIRSSRFHPNDILTALPCLFEKRASQWYRTVVSRLDSWSTFERLFRKQFVPEYNQDDLEDDLRSRTQGKGEDITTFLTNFRSLILRFEKPPSMQQQTEIAWKRLRPEYRTAMQYRKYYTLDELEDGGRLYERQRNLNAKFTEPPPPEKMHIKGIAFKSSACRNKIAAFDNSDAIVDFDNELGDDSVKMDAETDMIASMQRVQVGHRASDSRQQKAWHDSSEHKTTPTPAPNLPIVNQSSASKDYIGICFSCQAVGHHSSDCPLGNCFVCKKPGHIARNCESRSRPSTPVKEYCQVCHAPDTTFPRCEKCRPLWSKLQENCQPGEQ
ncbi:hypothetical protein TKK_0013496 [Trichogramma kaykai]|uniref:CCHC-type domain-containing protein n=1 Tax=Trichogramma kaykai TaxID=54128 RepID=A0ABD2WJI9_9HYME